MNKKCVVCEKSVYSYPGYYTDGKSCVCNECAASNSFAIVIRHIENTGVKSGIFSVYSDPIVVSDAQQSGLVNQTNPNAQYNQTACSDFRLSEKRDVPSETPYKCEQCAYYYGEIDSCMYEEMQVTEEVRHDIDTMSHDDFFSKYADNPTALAEYVNCNGEPDD